MRVLYRPYQFTNPSERNTQSVIHTVPALRSMRLSSLIGALDKYVALQYHYANLEAIALQLDPPEPKDDTLPLTDQIAKVITSCFRLSR